MSNLLQVVKLQSKALDKDSAIPVMVEFPVNPECAPFLVSSSNGLVWIDQAHPGEVVKAAPRKGTAPGDLFREIIEEIARRGKSEKWGNWHSFSPQGLQGAIQYIQSYDFDDLEVLVPRERDKKGEQDEFKRPEWLRPKEVDLPIRPSGWVPDDCAVVVPKDRDFVGMIGHLTSKVSIVMVHNPARGIAIAWDG